MKVDKYDAGRKCFYSVDIDDLEKEYQSLGLTEEEIANKLDAMRQSVAGRVAELIGADKDTITLTQDSKNGTIKIEASKKVKEDK